MIDDERRQFNEDNDREWEREQRLEDAAELDEYRRSEYEYRQSLKAEQKAERAAEVLRLAAPEER